MFPIEARADFKPVALIVAPLMSICPPFPAIMPTPLPFKFTATFFLFLFEVANFEDFDLWDLKNLKRKIHLSYQLNTYL